MKTIIRDFYFNEIKYNIKTNIKNMPIPKLWAKQVNKILLKYKPEDIYFRSSIFAGDVKKCAEVVKEYVNYDLHIVADQYVGKPIDGLVVYYNYSDSIISVIYGVSDIINPDFNIPKWY